MDVAERIERLARGFNRTVPDIERQLADADAPPRDALRNLERRLARLQHRVLTDDEARDLDEMAVTNGERYEQERILRDATEHAARRQLTLGQRLDRALSQSTTLAAAACGNTNGRVTGNTDERIGPPQPPGALFENAVSVADRYGLVMDQYIARLETEVDAARIRQMGGQQKVLTTQQRDDKLLREWEGVRSEIVSVLAPEFGTPRAVEKARSRNDRRPIDGTRLTL